MAVPGGPADFAEPAEVLGWDIGELCRHGSLEELTRTIAPSRPCSPVASPFGGSWKSLVFLSLGGGGTLARVSTRPWSLLAT